MTATNHVVAGALIAAFIHQPVVALPLAFASHYVLDALPHFDYFNKTSRFGTRDYVSLAADCALAASILCTLIVLHPVHVWLMVACGVAAASPDLMWLYYLILRKGPAPEKRPLLVRIHHDVQKHTSFKLWPIELAWLAAAGSLLVANLHP